MLDAMLHFLTTHLSSHISEAHISFIHLTFRYNNKCFLVMKNTDKINYSQHSATYQSEMVLFCDFLSQWI